MRTAISASAVVFCAVLLVAANAAAQSNGALKVRVTAAQEVIDEAGRRVLVPASVQRIVSLAPSITETVYALGAEERLVGVTEYCDYPPEAQTKPKVGGAINPSLEHVVALKPDLVLVTRALNRLETVEALERLGLAVYATAPDSVEDVIESTRRLAVVIGAPEQGEALARALRARLDAVKQKLAGRAAKRVLFVVWHDPLISIGKQTFLADALRQAGAESMVETTQDWPHVSLEEVVRLQPEYLIFASAHANGAARAYDALRERPGWRNLDAMRQRRIAVISDAVNRPSPRLVDAIEQLARQLHPDAFEERPENGKGKMEKGLQSNRQTDFRFSLFDFRGGAISEALPSRPLLLSPTFQKEQTR